MGRPRRSPHAEEEKHQSLEKGRREARQLLHRWRSAASQRRTYLYSVGDDLRQMRCLTTN